MLYRDEVRRLLLKHGGYECAVRPLPVQASLLAASLAAELCCKLSVPVQHELSRRTCAGELERVHAGLSQCAVCHAIFI